MRLVPPPRWQLDEVREVLGKGLQARAMSPDGPHAQSFEVRLGSAAFAELPQRRIERRLGDLATGGKGELILAS